MIRVLEGLGKGSNLYQVLELRNPLSALGPVDNSQLNLPHRLVVRIKAIGGGEDRRNMPGIKRSS